MRLLEFALTSLIFAIALFGENQKIQDKKTSLIGLFAGLWGIQVLFEGFRWQSWALVLASALVLLGLFTTRKLMNTLSAISLLAAVALTTVFPIPATVPTTGMYAVGTQTYHLIDTAREEHYASEAGLPREFVAQVWYPAEAGTGQQARWMPDIDQAGPALAEWLDLPSFILNHLKYADSNAYTDATPVQAAGGYPLLIFSHGWTGFKEQNSTLMEELASQGYIVVSINHTYGSILTVFPDGHASPRNPNALPSGVSLEEYDIAANLLLRQWAGDIAYTVQMLEANTYPLLNGLIDFSRIGAMGHSTGGGAVLEYCFQAGRCAALFAMDPWVEPLSETVRQTGSAHSALFLFSENWDTLDRPARNYGYARDWIANTTSDVVVATVAGTKHMDYSMLPLLTPLAETIGLKGPINGERMIEIMNVFAVTYFDNSLKQSEGTVAEIEGYPEVAIGLFPDE